MGTRHLIIVVSQQEVKVAQYGQWDGYPDGQEKRVLAFLKRCNLNRFRRQVEKVHFATTEDELQIADYLAHIGVHDEWMTLRQHNRLKLRYPTLSRDTGAKVLSMIYRNNAPALILRNAYTFARYSVFCEWCYVIDLDVQTFEIYKGFNELPLQPHDRFYPLQYKHCMMEFYPVRITKSYSLKDLPTIEEFLNNFNTH